MGIQTRLGVEGPSLLSIRGHCSQYYGWGFRAQGTEGGPEASQWDKEGAGKEALECSRLRWVQSLVGELRSHVQLDVAKNEYINKIAKFLKKKT